MTRILRKDRLRELLERSLRERSVFAPVERGGVLLLGRVQEPGEMLLGAENSRLSPKSALFPQKETLFRYTAEGGRPEIDAPDAEGKGRILFGIRPCDARGLLLLAKVFGGGRGDPYFAEKWARTLVVSLACEVPSPTCFCHSVGGGPCSSEGSDVLLLDLGECYAAESITEKGAAFLEDRAFAEPDEGALSSAREIKRHAEASARDLGTLDLTEAGKQAQFVHESLWSDLAESCIGCGICTYLCPTCHCFDLCDEGSAAAGERIRIWDSCQFPLFTQEASGFNPRPTNKERFRQRIMHKFVYLPESRSMVGCVGCGRCVSECPVNLDIREVAALLSRGGGQ